MKQNRFIKKCPDCEEKLDEKQTRKSDTVGTSGAFKYHYCTNCERKVQPGEL